MFYSDFSSKRCCKGALQKIKALIWSPSRLIIAFSRFLRRDSYIQYSLRECTVCGCTLYTRYIWFWFPTARENELAFKKSFKQEIWFICTFAAEHTLSYRSLSERHCGKWAGRKKFAKPESEWVTVHPSSALNTAHGASGRIRAELPDENLNGITMNLNYIFQPTQGLAVCCFFKQSRLCARLYLN